jgi:hypothetical protein
MLLCFYGFIDNLGYFSLKFNLGKFGHIGSSFCFAFSFSFEAESVLTAALKVIIIGF